MAASTPNGRAFRCSNTAYYKPSFVITQYLITKAVAWTSNHSTSCFALLCIFGYGQMNLSIKWHWWVNPLVNGLCCHSSFLKASPTPSLLFWPSKPHSLLHASPHMHTRYEKYVFCLVAKGLFKWLKIMYCVYCVLCLLYTCYSVRNSSRTVIIQMSWLCLSAR